MNTELENSKRKFSFLPWFSLLLSFFYFFLLFFWNHLFFMTFTTFLNEFNEKVLLKCRTHKFQVNHRLKQMHLKSWRCIFHITVEWKCRRKEKKVNQVFGTWNNETVKYYFKMERKFQLSLIHWEKSVLKNFHLGWELFF